MRVLQVVVLIVFGVIAARLAYIQLIDSKYEELARGNALRYEVQYPSRGEVFDRNGEYLVQSRECYDLMVIYREMDREGFDTTLFCQVTGLSHEGLVRELANARVRPRAPRMVMNYMSKEDKLRFDECNFAGFYTVYRTARQYPRKVGETCWDMWGGQFRNVTALSFVSGGRIRRNQRCGVGLRAGAAR